MNDKVDGRLRRLQQQISAFRKLHDDDLQLLIDELRGLASDLDAPAVQASDAPADSPRRAKWLAEQEERSHLSRRDLLRGRGSDPEQV